MADNYTQGANHEGLGREFGIWQHIVERTTNPKAPGFKMYGGRGITVCDRWKNGDGELTGFMCFIADIGRSPSDEHSVDRYPDNNGPYSPENTRWATRSEQARNRRSNRVYTIDGTEKPLVAWCEEFGVGYNRTYLRLSKGWPIEVALGITERTPAV